MSDSEILLREGSAGVVTLTLNRPKQYNALSEELLARLQEELDTLAADSSARVVVLAGSGPAFCAGHDLKQMRAHEERSYFEELFARCSAMMLTLRRIPQPVIAKVDGIATAAGCQLVASCDLAVASERARFATSGINVGLFCATPAVPLVRNVSRKRAFEMLITGAFIDAHRALEEGLVNRVVSPDELDGAVEELAAEILSKPREVVAEGKATFYRQLGLGIEDAYDHASLVMASAMMSEDAAEGIDAFLEKRPPSWGR